jgi:two-component system OmpR family sensor kinase
MTLRARLLVLLAALLAGALVISGVLVVGVTRANLVASVDDGLRATRDLSDIGVPGPDGGSDVTGRRYAALIFDPAGSLLTALPSGLPSAPDALPQLPEGGVLALPLGAIVDGTATDGSLSYRLLRLRFPNGQPVVLAAPLRDVDAAVAVLVRTLLLVGLIVLALAVLAGWWLLRRGLRPLERVTATAERISAGDLGYRVGAAADGSEVARLGQAFDAMLDQIESAFIAQRQALADKQRSENRLRRFVADASHELRTPLTSLRGYADLYAAGGLDEQDALAQAMRRIGSESRRMAELVEDMLLLARLDQGRPLRRDPVSLSRLADDAVTDARALEPQRPLSATIAPQVSVIGDEDRLRQLIGNLLANVRVHTPAGTPLEVDLSTGQDKARLAVIDHGPGIAAEHAGHIFDRFYRGDAGRSRERGGAGLGLAIAASVASAHGGSLDYASTSGGGATFTLTLPLATSAAVAGADQDGG